MAPSGERRRVSYTVSDSMVCIRRERVQVPCAELARRIERTDSLGDRLTGAPGFEPVTSRFVVAGAGENIGCYGAR